MPQGVAALNSPFSHLEVSVLVLTRHLHRHDHDVGTHVLVHHNCIARRRMTAIMDLRHNTQFTGHMFPNFRVPTNTGKI